MKAIQNALHGWRMLGGLGPVYFAADSESEALYAFLTKGTPVPDSNKLQLSRNRTRVTNFFTLIDPKSTANLKQPDSNLAEVETFLRQLHDQSAIWQRSFKSLDLSAAEGEFFLKVVALTAPVLFNMGFHDAIPHSAQVSRLTASMAFNHGGRASEVLMALIVGWLHDPKLHPAIDLEKENLATHPISASALAFGLMKDQKLRERLKKLFRGNKSKIDSFALGLVDALGINNDSRFVNMMVILPAFNKRFGNLYGLTVADELKQVIEGRLESASKDVLPPKLPDHLHGALSQMKLDSGLRGLSGHGWREAIRLCGLQIADPVALFDQLLGGDLVSNGLSDTSLRALNSSLSKVDNAVLRADVNASSLLHHHQEVILSGSMAASALVIADPMMLSAHKVLPVYQTAIHHRLEQYVGSFDDNIRLLPYMAQLHGARWQRAVYLAIVRAADLLSGSTLVAQFQSTNESTTVQEDICSLRALILKTETWGTFAQSAGDSPEAKQVIETLKSTYETLVNEYRQAVYRALSQLELDKFTFAG